MNDRPEWKPMGRRFDLVDIFEYNQRGIFFLQTRPFTNQQLSYEDYHPVIQHDINWPAHMEYTIENNIPVPTKQGNISIYDRSVLDTAMKLEPGQSFFVPLDGTKRQINALASWFSQKIKPKKGDRIYTTRSTFTPTEKQPKTGIRIWRLE